MNSMTGYGSGIAEINNRKLTVELKTVNHRFLDINIKMPKIFNALEDYMRSLIKKHIARGHIDVYVNFVSSASGDYRLNINEELARQYKTAADRIAGVCGIKSGLTAEKLLNYRDVLNYEENGIDEDECKELIDNAFEKAFLGLKSMRSAEGERIRTDLLEKLNNIGNATQKIKEFAPKQVEKFRDDLLERIKNFLGDIAIDEAKLLNEIVFYADKVAVDEEYTRLQAHIEHFEEIINKNEPIGRQLDFIVQEMNREANTIGSKCNEIFISNLVLSLKTDIEKLREQIQNVE